MSTQRADCIDLNRDDASRNDDDDAAAAACSLLSLSDLYGRGRLSLPPLLPAMAYSLSVSLLRVLASCRPLNEWISWCGFMCDGIAGVRRDRESVQDKAGHRSIWAGVSSLSCTTTTTAARPTTSLPPRTGRLCVSAVVQLVPYFGARYVSASS